jgi:hypothetical protein
MFCFHKCNQKKLKFSPFMHVSTCDFVANGKNVCQHSEIFPNLFPLAKITKILHTPKAGLIVGTLSTKVSLSSKDWLSTKD